MEDARIFVCEENECRIGLGMEMANGCVIGALDEQFNQMFEQITLAYVRFKGFGMMTNDEMQEIKDNIITAIEEAPVLNREQFMAVVNRCQMLADFSQQCEDIPNLPFRISDVPITYEEMEEEFWEINPELRDMLNQLLDDSTILEAEVVEPTEIIDNGTVQLIEHTIDEFDPEEDNVEDNPVLVSLIQDYDNLRRRDSGLLLEPNLNHEIEEEETKSLFRRLWDKISRRND